MPTPLRFGAVPLPVENAAPGEAAGDPAVSKVLGYLQTVLNHYGGNAWEEIAPDFGELVKGVYFFDPSEGEFAEPQTPALYGWREEAQSEQIAADYRIATGKLVLLWLAPADDQFKRVVRSPFANAIAKIVVGALMLGSDPAWIDPGDTDPRAADEGSLVWEIAGFWRVGKIGWKRAEVELHLERGEQPARYPGLQFEVEVQERLVVDPGDELDAATGTVKSCGGALTHLSFELPKPP